MARKSAVAPALASAHTPKPAPAALTDAPAALIEELGRLEAELAPHAWKVARVKTLRDQLRAHYASAPASSEYMVQGEKFFVRIGPRAKESTIDIPALVKAIGARAFHAFAQCSLKSMVAAGVASDVVAAVVSTEQTGTRSITTYEREKAAA